MLHCLNTSLLQKAQYYQTFLWFFSIQMLQFLCHVKIIFLLPKGQSYKNIIYQKVLCYPIFQWVYTVVHCLSNNLDCQGFLNTSYLLWKSSALHQHDFKCVVELSVNVPCVPGIVAFIHKDIELRIFFIFFGFVQTTLVDSDSLKI